MSSWTLIAYVGPETMLPLTSIVAGIVGVFMMFGRGTIRFLARSFRSASREK